MKSELQRREDARVAEQASDWVSRLGRGDSSEHEAFAKWLTESRRNVEEFLFASAVDKALEDADPQRCFDVQELAAQSRENVVELATNAAPSPPLRSIPGQGKSHARWGRWAAAITTLGLLLTALWWQSPDFFVVPESYVTKVGEQHTIRLTDGSMVQLNTRSRLKVRFTAQARELTLIEGEALFQVRRDPVRPFRVNAGSAVVQAVGTEFNIYRRGESATVAVIEGSVQVQSPSPAQQPARLAAGQEAHVASSGRIVKQNMADVQRTIAWRQRRLMFHKDTLADITTEFNRYNSEPRIRIEGEAVRAKRYTGIFDADDPDSLIEYLRRDGSLSFEQRDGEIWIHPRLEPPR